MIQQSIWKRTVVLLVAIVVGLVAITALGTGAAVGAAIWSAQPAVFLGAGLLVTACATAGLATVLLRRKPAVSRRRAAAAAAVLLTSATAAAWLTPLDEHRPFHDQRDVGHWNLGTGSRLTFLKVPAQRPRRPWPVVVLHGGPGIADLSGDRAFWGQLARDGFDVYLYAQLGAGSSTRLADPAGYRLDRDVDDLEQIRRTLRTDRLILVGHSHGGVLAAAYLSAHPTRVDRVVLSSPGPLDPGDHSGDRATARLTPGQRLQLAPLVLQPRALLGYLLLQVNPYAAHSYLPDAEADYHNDAILTRAQTALRCTDPAGLMPVTGSGFYRLQYPQSAVAAPQPDLRGRLAGKTTPALVIKGGCDYLSWSAAEDYRQALPNTTLIYLPMAGHNAYQDQPGPVLAATRAFLTEQPPPVAPYTAAVPPPDYQRN